MIRRRLIGTIAALVTLAVLGSAGGAAAVWTASISMPATASSTTIATTLAQAGGLSTTYRYAGTTSAAATGQLTITNSGGAPLSYTLANAVSPAGSALAQATTLRLWTGSCGSAAPTGAQSTTLADPAPPLPVEARVVGPGTSAVVCLSTHVNGASNQALQGQSVTSTFRATGVVGTNWTTEASAGAITQSVYRLGAPGAPTCTNEGPFEVKLTWNAPANRDPGATLRYHVTNASVPAFLSNTGTVSVTLKDGHISSNGDHQVRIVASETVGSLTTSVESPAVTVRRSTLGPSIRYECVGR